ncbi:MAG TPA: hypothetical protein VGK67_32255 [Myxococcales bacterium]
MNVGHALLERACSLGERRGCALLFENRFQGPGPNPDGSGIPYVPDDDAIATGLAAWADETRLSPPPKTPPVIDGPAHRVGTVLYELCSKGSEKDEQIIGCESVRQPLSLLCSRRPDACAQLAAVLARVDDRETRFLRAEFKAIGVVLPKDGAAALKEHLSVCVEARFAPSCLRAGELLDASEPTAAARLYRKACGEGLVHACVRLALLSHEHRGVPVLEPQEVQRLLRSACLSNDLPGCSAYLDLLCPKPAACAAESTVENVAACYVVDHYFLKLQRELPWGPAALGIDPDPAPFPLSPRLRRYYLPFLTRPLAETCRKVVQGWKPAPLPEGWR